MYSWDDLRFFLAVHREGSLTRAARRLKVDPTTVGRRLDALEQGLDQPLFIRSRQGWTLAPAGERILAAAERVEEGALDVGRVAAGTVDEPAGRVRITTVDVLATRVIAPHLPELHARYPKLRLDVICTPMNLDLLRGEADLALRSGRPVEGSLIARRVTSATERPYASRAFLQQRGLDPEVGNLDGLPALVAFTDEAWAVEAGARLSLRTSSANMLISGVLAGGGVGMLPDVVAARHPELVALEGVGGVRQRPLWLCMHRDLARVTRVRVVADFLAEALAERVPSQR